MCLSTNANSISEGRRCLAILLFFGNAILYAMRVNLSVAIVAMVGSKNKNAEHHSIDGDSCPRPPETDLDPKAQAVIGEFAWDERAQGVILGSFFCGYTCTNLLGGVLAERIGGRIVYGMGVTLTAVLTLLSPLAAKHSTTAFIMIRVLEGMTEGVTFPALNVLMSRWVPAASRSSFLSSVLAGCQMGTVVTMVVTGWLCESLYGWPSVFYLFGSIGLVWGVFWFPLVSDAPPTSATAAAGLQHLDDQKDSVPWRAILTSPPFLCVVAAHTCANWGFYCLLTEMPSYLAHVLHLDVHTNGTVSSLPYLCKWMVLLCYSRWVDHSVATKRITLTRARKMSGAIGLLAPAVLLASIQYAGCSRVWVVALLCLAVGVSGAEHSGPLCAFQELAPNYAGTLSGISNTVATLPGFLAPQIAGYLTQDQESMSSWRQVFLLATAMYCTGAALYLAFMSAEVQPWNSPHGRKHTALDRVSLLRNNPTLKH